MSRIDLPYRAYEPNLPTEMSSSPRAVSARAYRVAHSVSVRARPPHRIAHRCPRPRDLTRDRIDRATVRRPLSVRHGVCAARDRYHRPWRASRSGTNRPPWRAGVSSITVRIGPSARRAWRRMVRVSGRRARASARDRAHPSARARVRSARATARARRVSARPHRYRPRVAVRARRAP